MSLGGSGNTRPEEKSRIDKYTEADNVVDIKNDLNQLKQQITGTTETKDISPQDKIFADKPELNTSEMTREQFVDGMDKHVEDAFDTYVKNPINQNRIKELLKKGEAGTEELENEFNLKIRGKAFTEFNNDYNTLYAHQIKEFRFELNHFQDLINTMVAEGGAQNIPGKNPELSGFEYDKDFDHYIDPNTLQRTKIDSYTYLDFTKITDKNGDIVDKNGNKMISNKELKNMGLVNRYRNNNRDKVTAITGILNEDLENDFQKKDIRGINRDDLTDILDQMLDPLEADQKGGQNNLLKLVSESKDEEGVFDRKIFKKSFKDYFKDNFIKTDKYKSKGLFSETGKIADLIATAIENQEDTEFRDALERLADVGDAVKNMDYTGAHNNDVLLNYIKPADVFLFLCDFDSDGVVNSTDIDGKNEKNKKRRDTGSVMGGQLYTNLLQYAETKFEDIDGDGIQEKVIEDGKKTSTLIINILQATAADTKNDTLREAIKTFITEKTKNNATITMSDFTEFMKNGTYTNTEGTTIKVSGAADIKEFLKTLGEQLNEGKDLSWLFIDKTVIQESIRTNAQAFKQMIAFDQYISNTAALATEYPEGNPFTSNIEEHIQTEVQKNSEIAIDKFITENQLQNEFNKDMLKGARTTCAYNTFKVITLITDMIYMRLGNESVKTLAGMFEGSVIGGVKYSFYRPNGTINERKVHEALTGFVAQRLTPSVGLGLGEKGRPILGAGISFERLSKDLGDKFKANASVSLDLKSLWEPQTLVNFDISCGYARQINKKNVTRLETKRPIPVNRIGIEGGLGINFQDLGAYVGISFERDFPAGIEQKARYYDGIMKKMLGVPNNIAIYKNKEDFTNALESKVTADAELKNEKEFLFDMIHKIGSEMQIMGAFELIEKETDPVMQQAILRYMYETTIDAFHENAIEQKSYEQLTGKVKLTRFGLKTSIMNIIMRTSVGAGMGTVFTPGIGTILGAASGMILGMVNFSTWKTSYVEDAYGKGRRNYSNIEMGIGAEQHPELLENPDLETLRVFLEEQLNPNEKNITVTIENNKIAITAMEGGVPVNPLRFMNVYYNTDVRDNNGFSFDEKTGKLTLGNVPMRISRNIKRDHVETFLTLGADESGKMIKLEKNRGAQETVKPLEQTDYYKDLDINKITNCASTPELAPYTANIMKAFAPDGSLVKNSTEIDIPAPLQGTKVNVGTLTFKQDINGKLSIVGYNGFVVNGVATPTPNNMFKIDYIVETAWTGEPTKIGTDNYNELPQIDATKLFTITDTRFGKFTDNTLSKTLSVFDNSQINLYDQFITEAVYADHDKFIDATDYNNAFTLLKTILDKNTAYTTAAAGTELGNLKSLIDTIAAVDITKIPNVIYDKAFIVDRFKAIFSYDRTYTVGNQVPRNRLGYKKLFGPDNTTAYPLEYDYKTDLSKKLGGTTQLQRTRVDNLVGFTGFYRANSQEGKKFSMTALGGTNVLTNGNLSESMAPINQGDDLKNAETWFVNNLMVNTTNQQVILAKLNQQLTSHNIILTADQLPNLFSGEHKTIDIGGKIVKLDLQYCFYLLGECSNESIGALIQTIHVYEKVGGNYKETIHSGATDGISGRRWNTTVTTQTLNAEYDILSQQKDLTLSAAITGLRKKPTPESQSVDSKDPSNNNGTSQSTEGKDESNATLGGDGSQMPPDDGTTDDGGAPLVGGGGTNTGGSPVTSTPVIGQTRIIERNR